MIDITKDKKGEGFILTKTQNILGIDFHRQLNISPDEMDDLYMWFFHHYIRIMAGTSIDEAIELLQTKNIDDKRCGSTTYTQFNGKVLSTKMSKHEVYEKVFGKLKDRH